ncbi:MAG: hypothetical protein WBW85_12210 [Terriglobales bacterium]
MNISRPIRNLAVATAIGTVSGTLCWAFLHRFQLGAGDFTWSYHGARALLSGQDPYANTPPGMIPYPLPAALVALPFAPFPADLAAALFFGISSGLLALGLVRHSPQRLFIFLAYPYWSALITAQWPPLIMCGAFFPLALVFCVAKPQTGTPMALAHLSRQGLIAASALLLASLILMPRWPLEWIPQLSGYRDFVPFLVFRDHCSPLLFCAGANAMLACSSSVPFFRNAGSTTPLSSG